MKKLLSIVLFLFSFSGFSQSLSPLFTRTRTLQLEGYSSVGVNIAYSYSAGSVNSWTINDTLADQWVNKRIQDLIVGLNSVDTARIYDSLSTHRSILDNVWRRDVNFTIPATRQITHNNLEWYGGYQYFSGSSFDMDMTAGATQNFGGAYTLAANSTITLTSNGTGASFFSILKSGGTGNFSIANNSPGPFNISNNTAADSLRIVDNSKKDFILQKADTGNFYIRHDAVGQGYMSSSSGNPWRYEGDYSAQMTNDNDIVSLKRVRQVINDSLSALSTGVTSFEGRTGAVTAQSGDYLASEVTNAFDKTADDAGDVSYTPATTDDWPGTDPNDAGEALDSLASRVTNIESILDFTVKDTTIAIGAWNLDSAATVTVTTGIAESALRSGISIIVFSDSGNAYTAISDVAGGPVVLIVDPIITTSITINRVTGSFLDGTGFDDSVINRGYISFKFAP